MADRTFTNFSRLPPEIRTQIWKAAIRPDRPGVQYFEVLKIPKEMDMGSHILELPGSNLFLGERKDLWTTNPDNDLDENNHRSEFQRIRRAKSSSYFWDAGLWTACQESRVVMEDHVDFTHFATHMLNFEPNRHPEISIRVDNREDLFIVEVNNVEYDDYVRRWTNVTSWLSFWDLDGNRARGPAFTHTSIAFEFDASWLSNLTEKMFDVKEQPFEYHPSSAFVHYALDWNERRQPALLWLVDRNIRRSPELPRPPARFHDANTSYHKILGNEAATWSQSAFAFLHELDSMLAEIPEVMDPPFWQSGSRRIRFTEVWVLECRDI